MVYLKMPIHPGACLRQWCNLICPYTEVLVLDGGLVAEQGTHDELLHIDGVYKRLVLKQLEAGSTGNEPGGANADVAEAPDSENPQYSRQNTV